MRIFELTTHVNAISRSQGRTATAAAAYRSGTAIFCQYAETEHDYSRKGGVIFSEIVAPEGAPDWTGNRTALWNAAELAERNGKRGKNAGKWKANAQTAREFMFSFPFELSEEGRISVARQVAGYLAATGVAVDINIHAPGREGDQRNWHCHILTTTRVIEGKGLGKKASWQTNRAESRQLASDVRALIARVSNDQLKAEGKAHLVHVEHRSFKDRGVTRQPQTHQGPMLTNQKRRASRKVRSAWLEATQQDQRARQVAENKKLREAQNAAWRDHSKTWQAQSRKAIKRIVEEARAARRAQEEQGGLRAIFLRVTGRGAKLEAERKARAEARLGAVRQAIRTLRTQIAQQKQDVREAQQAERQALKDRHAGETQNISRAFSARVGRDLAAERALRAAEVRVDGLEQERDIGSRTIEPER